MNGDRWAALEPVRQGVRAHMGGFGESVALGLGLRHGWGSQYRARQFRTEIKWLGIRSTPAYVASRPHASPNRAYAVPPCDSPATPRTL